MNTTYNFEKGFSHAIEMLSPEFNRRRTLMVSRSKNLLEVLKQE